MLIIVSISVPMIANAEHAELKAGTTVNVKLINSVSEETSHRGDIVLYEVTKDVLAENNIVAIQKGTQAQGVYNIFQKCGLAACKKIMGLTIEKTSTTDGTPAALKMTTPAQKENVLTDNTLSKAVKKTVGTVSNTATSAVDIALKPLTILTGTNNKVLSGTQFKAYVSESIQLDQAADAAEEEGE